ncbi:hypothetical protein AGMMS49942_14540 [Spirochaetia bacterium]|nr:hypothetical protein AGMMS49942_14540 [Spirochaetia bacterium]
MDTLAITYKADRLLTRVITRLTIQHAEEFCIPRGLPLKPLEVRAMWDTGSTGCCVSEKLANALDLIGIASLDLTSAHGSKPANVYLIDLLFPDNTKAKNVIAAEIIPSGEFEIIIGMNIITRGDFALSNDRGKTVMSFRLPSTHSPIDFSEQEDPRL